MTIISPEIGARVLDLATNGAFIQRATDPVNPGYVLPTDFAAQFPQPLDTTEIIAMCEEVTILKYLPEKITGLKGESWRELNELAFLSGTAAISFADGDCPEGFSHDGDDTTINKKNIGTKKVLGVSDILHSLASQAAGYGILNMVGPTPAGLGMPGANQATSFTMEAIAGLKEKEVLLGSTLVMNGWDNLLVNGDASGNALEFSGIVKLLAAGSSAHANSTGASGTFAASSFDRFLSEGCAKPTVLLGHPTAIQELLSAYMQLSFQGSQVIQYNAGTGGATGITPGYNFASFVNTGIGRLEVVADSNFPRSNSGGGNFASKIYGLRMAHNGEPLVYKATQIPLALNDLTPGCTTIAFELWAKTALVIKHLCAHSVYSTLFTGNIVTTCPVIL
jgi:hypothetical protein